MNAGRSVPVSSLPNEFVTTAAPASRVALASSYPSGAAQWTAVGVTNAALGAGNTMTVTAYVICAA